ncbi:MULTISPECIES: DUF4279 domain-containing protein [unclassified Micromonospora]|uniref:DUF4279 domain-containing protein n=1 Tax=unclassified Micromonospora TaxID=2617518 RepID=UPI003A8B89D5
MSDERSRRVALVVASEVVSVEELTAVVGVSPDRSLAKGQVPLTATLPIPAKENSWEICEYSDRSVAISEVIERLLDRVFPLRDAFAEVRRLDCVIKLEIVQWISEDDPHGPGFSLDIEALDFLAFIGAFVDVDQYLG